MLIQKLITNIQLLHIVGLLSSYLARTVAEQAGVHMLQCPSKPLRSRLSFRWPWVLKKSGCLKQLKQYPHVANRMLPPTTTASRPSGIAAGEGVRVAAAPRAESKMRQSECIKLKKNLRPTDFTLLVQQTKFSKQLRFLKVHDFYVVHTTTTWLKVWNFALKYKMIWLLHVSVFKTFWRRNFFLILGHPVYKMWIIQEPNTLELWNKLRFEEEKKKESIYHI